MRAGHLRQRIALQAPTAATNARGGRTNTWATFATKYGSVEALRGSEALTGERPASAITHRVELRSDEETRTLTAKHRLQWSGLTFEIVSVFDPTGRQREIVVECRRGAD